jgi:hypothetical protein
MRVLLALIENAAHYINSPMPDLLVDISGGIHLQVRKGQRELSREASLVLSHRRALPDTARNVKPSWLRWGCHPFGAPCRAADVVPGDRGDAGDRCDRCDTSLLFAR